MTQHGLSTDFPGLPVATHINSSEHCILNAKVSVITICANETYRKNGEECLIYKLGTLESRGMNV